MRIHTTLVFSVGLLVFMMNSSRAIAAISISGVGSVTRSSTDQGLSGITYAGGTQYYAINDSGALMHPMTIDVNLSSGSISSHSFANTVSLTGSDTEGIAWDPSTGGVWVSDETGATIKLFSTSGAHLDSVDVPTIYSNYRANYSFEALSMRGDALELWTMNEEALFKTATGVDDGSLSTNSDGSMCRLQRFTRVSVNDDWSANGQWAYLTDSISGTPLFGATGSERSGAADLCILPDGTVLVLERELGGSLIPGFRSRIYEVNTSAATDVSAITSLNGATYTPVTKTQRWTADFQFANYEGICLGPRLSDGSLSLLLISDGDGSATDDLYSLKCSGLSAWTLTVNSDHGAPNPYGTPLRYVNGDSITCSVQSPVIDETSWYVCTGWTLTGGTTGSGTGSTCTMNLSGDSTLTWNWEEGFSQDFPSHVLGVSPVLGPGTVADKDKNLIRVRTGEGASSDFSGATCTNAVGGAMFFATGGTNPGSSVDALSGLTFTDGAANTTADFDLGQTISWTNAYDRDKVRIFIGEVKTAAQSEFDTIVISPLLDGAVIPGRELTITNANYGPASASWDSGVGNISGALVSFAVTDIKPSFPAMDGIRLTTTSGDPNIVGTYLITPLKGTVFVVE